MTAAFSFAPGLDLRVSGEPGAVEHLRREYGPCEGPAAAAPALDIVFGAPDPRRAPASAVVTGEGRHKTVAWRVVLGDPAAEPLQAWITTLGLPAGIARSLVQGYVVEPLLSLAGARAGHVLLPGAGVVAADGLLVIIGPSRAGKSTIAARALATGRRVIGDDQVLVDDHGAWRPFPRRFRFYPDLEVAAPAAWRSLRPRTRAVLRARRLIALATRGFVRPSLAVSPVELGGTWIPDPLPAARIALVERRPDAPALATAVADAEQAVTWATRVLREQRARLAAIGGPAWAATLGAAALAEERILRAAFGDVPVVRVVVPAAWPATEGIARTAAALGLEPAS